MPQRVFLTLGWLVSSLVGVAVAEQRKGLGSRECPLDISVLWTAEVDSPVYGTPIILPSAGGVGKQVRYSLDLFWFRCESVTYA